MQRRPIGACSCLCVWVFVCLVRFALLSCQARVVRGQFGHQEFSIGKSAVQSRCAAMLWIGIVLLLASYGLLNAGWTVIQWLRLPRDGQAGARVSTRASMEVSEFPRADQVDQAPDASSTMQSASSASMTTATLQHTDPVIWVSQRLTWHTTESCIHLKTAARVARVTASVDVMAVLTLGGGAPCKTCRVHGAVAIQ